VELFLNFVWLSISLALVATWVAAVRRGDTKQKWCSLVALMLLVLLLLPVISMTDDLVAFDSPLEVEHVVRRIDLPLLQIAHDTASVLETGLLAVLLFIGFAILFSRLSRFSLRLSWRRLMDGFDRTVGIRPPPFAAFTA
jgi:hypothetical protein